jgi:hypothetical protein
MPEGIVGSFGGKVAEQWTTQLLTPAFAFWAGGLALWCLRHHDWSSLQKQLQPMSETALVVLAVAGLILVSSTAIIGQKFEFFVLRLLEGYWWPWPLRRAFVSFESWRYNRAMRIYQAVSSSKATAKQRRRFERAVGILRQIPPDPADRLPTRLGNILRYSERASDWRYGLDSIVCWSRLWLLLPDSSRKELADARADLDTGARVFLWGALFVVWASINRWSIVIALTVCICGYWWMKHAAKTYGDLIQATFDVYRSSLYAALRIKLPDNAHDERAAGLALSYYLANGSDDVALIFGTPPPASHT